MILAGIFDNASHPMLWAILIGWILSVVLHEFAHGIVAYLGGDYTIRERGGLSLNPLVYLDPVTSVLLPALFLLKGGIPFPGGSTRIRHDLIRTPAWQSAVAAAGPATNLILFFVCAVPLHQHFGWLSGIGGPNDASPLQVFLGAMALLQGISVLLNLIPVPPLDGFNMIRPWLPRDMQQSKMFQGASIATMVVLFFVFTETPFFRYLVDAVLMALRGLGFDSEVRNFFLDSLSSAFQ